jgi:hypothetical protein
MATTHTGAVWGKLVYSAIFPVKYVLGKWKQIEGDSKLFIS